MRSKLSDLKSLYTTLGGESTDVLNANSEIAVLNGILALGNVDSSKFIPDAIKAIADNFALIDPSPAATLIEKTVTANGTYNATSDSANGYSSVTVNVPTGAETFEVILNSTDGETFTPNKTFAETVAAMQNQTPVTMKMHFEIGGQTSEQVASFFYNAIEPESINAIYIPVHFTSSAVNGFIWNENGFGASSFHASMTIT